MVANFDYHNIKIYATATLKSCTFCPFWLVNTATLESGSCYITGTEVPLDGNTDTGRMPDCPIIVRQRKKKRRHK